MSGFDGWKHKCTQYTIRRQNNQIDECDRSTERRRRRRTDVAANNRLMNESVKAALNCTKIITVKIRCTAHSTFKKDKWKWRWWPIFPRVRGFWERVRQFIPSMCCFLSFLISVNKFKRNKIRKKSIVGLTVWKRKSFTNDREWYSLLLLLHPLPQRILTSIHVEAELLKVAYCSNLPTH